MARATGDVLPLTSILGGHTQVVGLPIGAGTSKSTVSTSFKAGEAAVITAASGDVDVAPVGTIDPVAGLVYIFAGSSEGAIVKRKGLAGTTGDADGDLIPCYKIDMGVAYATRNAFTGNDTNVGPAGTNVTTTWTIGSDCDLWRTTGTGAVSGNVNGDFGIDTAGDFFTIIRHLDSLGRDCAVYGTTPFWIVFQRD